jgi:hypothetical protein
MSGDTAYKTNRMSNILAPEADSEAQGQTEAEAEAPVEAEVREDLPEKYRGKTAEEIADMHANAERELGRIRNELGTYRGLVKDLSSLQRSAPEPSTVQEEDVDLSSDSIYTDPVGAIKKVVQHELKPVRKEQEQAALKAQVEMETAALEAEFPNLEDIVGSKEFNEFSNATGSRKHDLEVAANGDGLGQVRAARRLLEDFNDFQRYTKKTDEDTSVTAVEEAKKVSTDRGRTSAPISNKPKIYESDVISLINKDPVKYRSPSFQKELLSAITDGRFVKNT